MNKVLLIRNITPKSFGGSETYQLMLSEQFRKNGLQATIVSSSERLLLNAKENKLRVIKAPFNKNQNWSGWRNILLPFFIIWEIGLYFWYKQLFVKETPSVVNIQSRDDWIAATLAAKKLKIKIIWTDHADFKNWVFWNVNKRYKNPIGRKIVKLSKYTEHTIFISETIKKDTEELISPIKINNTMVVQNGAKDHSAKYKDIKSNKQSFIYVGRISQDKGLSELLSAFNKVSEKYPKATLSLYGDGPDLEKYKTLSVKNKNIIFHGHTDEPLKAMAENEIFVLPSYREGLSLSLLDAAMMEKAIIATDVGGTSEVVINQETGLLVPPKNSEALESAMLTLLENPELRKKLAKNVRNHYKENFDFEKIFKEKMLPLYRDN